MITINPKEIAPAKLHSYLLGAVSPRPIALASSIDKDGNVNLSPFSFFNCFGYNPPILIFSPARRGRDNTTKHTYENILEVPEVVINVVNFSIVQQTSLASTEYPKGTNEFVKAGFTPQASLMVKPPRVKESPASMECKVTQIINTGDQGGAGILVICEIVLMHVKEEVLDAEGKIDPYKLDAVARLGGDYYARIHNDSIFKVPKPLDKLGIGIDNIPSSIRNSKVLTGNDLGILGNIMSLPLKEDVLAFAEEHSLLDGRSEDDLHAIAKSFIDKGKPEDAWRVLLILFYKNKG